MPQRSDLPPAQDAPARSTKPTPKATTKSIADVLGLAQSTVSMALRRHPEISVQTQDLVLETADRLGYSGNAIARAMVTGRTHVLGLLLGYEIFEHVGLMLSGALAEANNAGYLIKIFRLCGTGDIQQPLRQCIEHRVDGMILHCLGPEKLREAEAVLRARNIPIVAMEGCTTSIGGRVDNDNVGGAIDAMRHLAELGHRRIGFMAGPNVVSAIEREQGYRTAVREMGLDAEEWLVARGGFNPVSAAAAAEALLSRPDRPTAVFCVTDYIAMVVLRVAARLGLRIPHDLSVVGYADLEFAKLTTPALTTVVQPFERIGEEAVRLVLEGVNVDDADRPNWRAERILPTKLAIRESTATVPAPSGSTR
ncbi:MAG TPA: LacI family DNA-binding transcriptional regulator [Tepidisphaeraceae bacterium]|nr:LacI family DNA-binding transcriptional regulator [Tepidisphaeraceae bacterium]